MLQYMQQDLSLPLDLSAFACDHIQVSFAAVSLEGRSSFSPAQSVCVEGGMYNYTCMPRPCKGKPVQKSVYLSSLSGYIVYMSVSLTLLENRVSNVFTS